jgi:hypothetical protein
MYSSTLSLPSALDGWVVNATPRPLCPSGITRYPLCRRLVRPQDRSGRVRKISPPAVVRSPDSPVAVPTELSSARMMVDVPLLLPDRGVNRECMATRLPKRRSNLHLDDSCWYFISRPLKLCFCVSLFDPVKPRLTL